MTLNIDPPPINSPIATSQNFLVQEWLEWMVQTQEKINNNIVAFRVTAATTPATQNFTVEGVDEGDYLTATTNTQGSMSATILEAKVISTNTVEITFSVAPGTDHIVDLIIIKRIGE